MKNNFQYRYSVQRKIFLKFVFNSDLLLRCYSLNSRDASQIHRYRFHTEGRVWFQHLPDDSQAAKRMGKSYGIYAFVDVTWPDECDSILHVQAFKISISEVFRAGVLAIE